MVKLIILLFIAGILYSLGSGLYYLVRERDEKDSTNVAKALTWRIGLSLLLFILIFIAFALGWLQPHSV